MEKNFVDKSDQSLLLKKKMTLVKIKNDEKKKWKRGNKCYHRSAPVHRIVKALAVPAFQNDEV